MIDTSLSPQNENVKSLKTTDITFRKDLYPRFEHRQALIEQYSQCIEFLPPITISQQNILIDGFHRLKAHDLAGITEIKTQTIEVTSEKELKGLAFRLNANHGLQLNQDEKKSYAIEMTGDLSVGELSKLLSVGETSIKRWTQSKRDSQEKERNRQIVELYLRAWTTQEKIGEMFDIKQNTVHEIIDKIKKGQMVDFDKAFTPYLYNVWNLQKQDNAMKQRFGSFPEPFMANLLYYHTEPLDIVYDPMTGGGTTVDVCKKMFRRYYCTDRKVTPGRESDIRQRELKEGLPEDLPMPQLVFLDPPYSLLAKGEYSEEDDKGDLGNMTVEEFYRQFHEFLTALMERKVKNIAYLIRPFWITGDGGWDWVDPMFELYDIIKTKYKIANRYVLPYSTQQYSALWVDRAKKQKKCLILNRELTIFEVK